MQHQQEENCGILTLSMLTFYRQTVEVEAK